METLQNQSNHPPFYRDEHLLVDLHQQLVILDGHTLTLTHKEYRLLMLLVQHTKELCPD